jgi:hypothetical protein
VSQGSYRERCLSDVGAVSPQPPNTSGEEDIRVSLFKDRLGHHVAYGGTKDFPNPPASIKIDRARTLRFSGFESLRENFSALRQCYEANLCRYYAAACQPFGRVRRMHREIPFHAVVPFPWTETKKI